MLQTDDKLCVVRSPPQGHPHRGLRQGVQGVRTSVPQYNVRTTGRKEWKSETYGEYGHGDDIGDDADNKDDDGSGGGNCNGWGYGC